MTVIPATGKTFPQQPFTASDILIIKELLQCMNICVGLFLALIFYTPFRSVRKGINCIAIFQHANNSQAKPKLKFSLGSVLHILSNLRNLV